MSVNLQLLGIAIEKLKDFLSEIFTKKGNNNSTTVKINGSNNIVSITEINNPTDIKPGWTSIVQDIQVSNGSSSEEFWLHIGSKDESPSKLPFINIGKYYTCTVDCKTIVFWIGAEVSTGKNEYSVYLFITKDLLEKQKLTPGPICKIEPDVNGAYVIPIDEFSIDGKTDIELKDVMDKKLQEFLTGIFQ